MDTASSNESTPGAELATFGAGCFWCVEAVLERLEGVLDVTSGYMGGSVPDPTYEQVCGGATGHAEVVAVRFDPALISYEALLDWFWRLHDPTTPDRQGNDVGSQYRSVVFCHDARQRATAERVREALAQSGRYGAPIVTQIVPAGTFYPAEAYHQDFYRLNPDQPYCHLMITPKLEKLGMRT